MESGPLKYCNFDPLLQNMKPYGDKKKTKLEDLGVIYVICVPIDIFFTECLLVGILGSHKSVSIL